jgi:hypothetical protein
MTDHLSKSGAHSLAAQIKDYWTARGYSGIQTSITPINMSGMAIQEPSYAVRSNIGPSGFPPKH